MCAVYHRLWGGGLRIQILVNPSKASHVLWAFQLHGWWPTNCTSVCDWCVKNWEKKYYTYAPWKNTNTKGIRSSILIACHINISCSGTVASMLSEFEEADWARCHYVRFLNTTQLSMNWRCRRENVNCWTEMLFKHFISARTSLRIFLIKFQLKACAF